MAKILASLLRPYPLRSTIKREIFISLFIALFIFITNEFFDPNIDQNRSFSAFCLFIGLVCFGYFRFGKLVFKKSYSVGNWLLIHQILFAFGLILLVGFINYGLIIYLDINNSPDLSTILPQNIFLGLLLATILSYGDYIFQLKKNLQQARAINLVLNKDLKAKTDIKDQTTELKASETSEKIVVELSNLLFIKSSGNYVEIHTFSSKSLLRCSIKDVCDQLSIFKHIQRCHRSYVVNILHVVSSEGNSHKLSLQLKNSDERVPVSRTYYKSLIKSEFFSPNTKIQN